MTRLDCTISIVVAIYQVEDYLDKCIQSIRNQTYPWIEIVLVVRDSGDGCVSICEKHKALDDRIIIVYQKGKGLVDARKEGTLAATGDYVYHMDGDDWLDPDKIEYVADFLQRSRPDMIYMSGFVYEGDKGKNKYINQITERIFDPVDDDAYSYIFPRFLPDMQDGVEEQILWSVWSWVVRRELLLQQQMLMSDSIIMAEDAVYTFLCLIKARSVAIIPTSLYHYVIREGSGMHTPTSIQDGNLEGAYKILKENFSKSIFSYDFTNFLYSFTNYVIVCWEYGLMVEQFDDFFYPYPTVVAGSKVIVYGAGRFGKQVIDAIMEKPGFSLVMWVDQNERIPPYKGQEVHAVSDILQTEYDYVMIAVLKKHVEKEIRENLLRMGVPDGKIALKDNWTLFKEKYPW